VAAAVVRGEAQEVVPGEVHEVQEYGDRAMKKTIFLTVIILLSVMAFAVNLKAQYIDDALRYSNYNSFITARAGGLNVSYLGVADDYAALFYNPAGLSLVTKTEMTFGLGFTRNNTETDFLGTKTTNGSNNAYLNNIGFVFPFRTKAGNGALALGYHLESNFSMNSKFSGFNTYSTMVNDIARYGTRDKNLNAAYKLWLTDENIITPIKDNLQQTGYVQEDGGLHNLSIGLSFDVIDYLSVGGSLTYKFGKYNYHRSYEEWDKTNRYDGRDSVWTQFNDTTWGWAHIDFNNFNLDENIEQSISGVTGSIGVQARVKDFMRFGLTVKFPTYYSIDEVFGYTARATFDTTIFSKTGTTSPQDLTPDRKTNSYHITSPFVFSAGLSFNFYHVTLTSGFEYTDVTQARFGADGTYWNSYYSMDQVNYYNNMNSQISQKLTGQIRWGIGAEYEFPPVVPMVLRASYASSSSPYIEDISGATMQMLSFGAGFYVAPNIRLDALYQLNKYSQQFTVYGDDKYAKYVMQNTPWNVGLQFTMRF